MMSIFTVFISWPQLAKLEYMVILGYVDKVNWHTQKTSCTKDRVEISSPDVFDMSEDHLEH